MSIYSQNIIEHYKFPQNKRKMKNFHSKKENINRSCWDSIVIYLKMEDDNETIKQITFEWNWCSISMATASILSDELIWMKRLEVLSLELKDIENILWINIWANRIKCAMLSLSTIKECLKSIL